MADVYDRWHKSHPKPGDPECPEHKGKVRTAEHGVGKRWQARWRDHTGVQKKENFERRAEAERFVAAMVTDLSTGSYVDRSVGRQTFETYAEKWRAAQPHRPSTAKAVHQHLRCYAYPVFGNRAMSSIRPTEVQAWVTGLTTRERPIAASTARTVFNTVRAVFRTAIRDQVVARDPSQHITLPEGTERKVVPLTVEQVSALIDAMPEQYWALGVVGAGTGLRAGELFGLQVRDIDFLRRTLTVDRQVQQTAGHGVYIGPPKTKRSRRTIPISQTVVEALADHLRRHPASGDEWIFTGPNGGPIVRTSFIHSAWTPAAKAAGLSKNVGMHALRHFFASALIRGGMSVKVVSERLGHSNAAMTLNVYAHLWPDDEDRTRQAIDLLLGGHVPAQCPRKTA